MKFLHTSDWHIGRRFSSSELRRDEQTATLREVLDHASNQEVDCVLIAGNVFDTSTPAPDAEMLVYGFFRDLHSLGIPAVVIAGNHDHPLRFEAISPLLRSLDIHLVGRPLGPESGGVVEVKSRDGKETALVAALPWVAERDAVDFAALQQEPGAPLGQYAERMKYALGALAAAFRPDTCNLMLAHLLINNAVIGPGGGERELHMSMGIYGLPQAMLPTAPQYIALGHVHKPQAVRKAPAVHYSGSLLQLDFGEREQDKGVNLVEVHPKRPAEVSQLPITAGRKLIDIGTPARGVAIGDLPAYADKVGDAWLRVFVDIAEPLADLTGRVREVLPNAVRVQRVSLESAPAAERPSTTGLGPVEMFEAFYRSPQGQGREPSKPTLDLFRALLEEQTSAAD